MFAKRSTGIIVVHNDEVLWIAGRPPEAGRCVLRLPMDQVLTDAGVADRIPKAFKGNYRSLCIVPDHWFGMARYPFQSSKPSLIEPFLERKLAAAFPERKQMRHFFNYERLADTGDDSGLLAYFLQDEKGYQLYDALSKIDVAPRHITTPAFLWRERLAQASADFQREGTLLIHMCGQECMLYFYFRGNFIFSRQVILTAAEDRMEALAFEINQSLYMFSQKTKNELNRVYLLACESDSCDLFCQALGREVEDLHPLLKGIQTLAIHDLPFLDGLLQPKALAYQAPFFSLTHRKAQQELAWEPVQWAGILIGALLLLPMIAENLMLGKMLGREAAEHRTIQQQINRTGAAIAEYDYALNSVLLAAERPNCADTVRRLLSGLPDGMRVKELSVVLDDQPAVKLNAMVRADDTDHLKSMLVQLVAGVKANFKTAQDFSINHIDIRMDPNGEPDKSPQYLLSMQLELT